MAAPSSSDQCFDRYVMIDWSANSSPKQGKDSIWVAVADRGGEVVFVHNPRTREEMASVLREILTDRFERVLVGCDFSFGYPAGLADVIADNPDASWRDVWSWVGAHILDEPNNRNNRFDVAAELNDRCDRLVDVRPFWGYPGASSASGVSRYRPESYAPFDEFRVGEHRLRADGLRPFSSWQLAYPGSVGSQMLMGIAWLERVRVSTEFGERIVIWPFETGLGETSLQGEPGDVVFAEVWPSMFEIDRECHDVLDAAQVMTVVQLMGRADRDGSIHKWSNPTLSARQRSLVLREEGWTLGVL